MTETGTRGAGVGDTFRGMWATRPVRPREGRKIAGVGAAIARRYDVDPVLVRVALVVTLFAGVGFWLYLALALALPGERADGPSRRDLRPHAMVGLAVLGFILLGSFWRGGGGPDGNGGWEGGGWGGGAIGVTLVALGLLYLLHRSRGDAPAAVPPGTPAVSLVKGAPAWDPLGAAPFAWDLPEPAPAAAPPAPKPPPVTAVTLALALLAGGATALLMLTFGALGPAWWPVLLGVVLAVLGAGLVVGSFLHAGRGLVPAAVLVGLLTWGTLAAPFDDWPGGGDVGELRIAPTTPAQLDPSYQLGLGDVDIDLSGLDLAVGPDGVTAPVRTSVGIGAGDVEITVPEDADVSVTLTAGAGSVAFGDERREGPNPQLTVVRDLGEDGAASGRPLEITVRAGAGEVEVQRD